MRRTAPLVLSLALALSACGFSSESGEASGTNGWTYTSGDGKTYTAEKVPERIIAQGEAAASLLQYGIKPVAIYLSQPLKESKSLQGLDLDGIEIIGDTWGQIDAEKAAELKPDLIVSAYWPAEKAYGGLEEGVEAEAKKVATLADVVGPSAGTSTVEMLDGFEELAVSLGADPAEGDVADDKLAFEAAQADFKAAVEAKPDLEAMAVSPADDVLYVAVPEHSAELSDFREWGLDVLIPNEPDPGFPYWENLSWENADKYQPDVVLLDDRTYDASLATAKRQPTWTDIDAVAAGAVTPWPAYWISTYSAYAEQLEKLTTAIENADA